MKPFFSQDCKRTISRSADKKPACAAGSAPVSCVAANRPGDARCLRRCDSARRPTIRACLDDRLENWGNLQMSQVASSATHMSGETEARTRAVPAQPFVEPSCETSTFATPSIPHASEGGFKLVGEHNFVAKRRAFDTRTQGRTSLCQSR